MTVRWGAIGTGTISGRFIPDLQLVSGGNVTGVWGRSQEKAETFAAEHGIAFATADRDDLLAREDIDAVYIATPISTHLDLALEALEAGKHVLMEKPMALSAEEVEIIFRKAQEVGRFAMEAMWMRFNPLHLEIMDRIQGGLLGDVRSVRASFGMPFISMPDRKEPGSVISAWLDRGIYPVTLAHWALGAPDTIEASGTSQAGVDVSGYAALGYAGGRFAQVAASSREFLDLSATISGERGWVTIDPMFWAGTTARVHAGSLRTVFHEPELLDHPRQGNGFQPMLRAVHEALDDGLLQHPHHDAASTLTIARTLDTIRRQILQPEEAPAS